MVQKTLWSDCKKLPSKEKQTMQQTVNIVHDLSDLLTRNYDAEKGYVKAAEKVEHEGLKNYMIARAENRYDFGHELKVIIKGLDGAVYKGTSFEGDLHRLWIDFKNAVTSGDGAIFEECIRNEQNFIEKYREMLSEDSFPESLRTRLNRQLFDATRAVEDLMAMKDVIEER